MPNIKKGGNIFATPQSLKAWAIDLSDACGSVIINKKPNVSKISTLIDKFANDYNYNQGVANATKEEE
tara:strand:+ start:10856 stop:11059 length:204 start_codon:yes stop_codon:yes gene_type:complete